MYDQLPPELQPMSPWAYFGYEILYALPVVGWIFLVCHAIGARNVNKRNFARSFFVVYILQMCIRDRTSTWKALPCRI